MLGKIWISVNWRSYFPLGEPASIFFQRKIGPASRPYGSRQGGTPSPSGTPIASPKGKYSRWFIDYKKCRGSISRITAESYFFKIYWPISSTKALM